VRVTAVGHRRAPVLTAGRYQSLSTDITDEAASRDARFVIYPSSPKVTASGRRLTRPAVEEVEVPAAHTLGRAGPLRSTDDVLTALRFVLEEPILDDFLTYARSRDWKAFGYVEWSDVVLSRSAPEVREFSKYLLETPVIPFRNSPIIGESLARLVAKSAPGTGSGMLVGALAGSSHPALMLLTVPGGMIVGGTALGVATALEKGLHERILRMIVPPVESPATDPQSPDDPPSSEG
jgi:hypothetical protein